MNTKQIDTHLDAILRASGSGLRHYTMLSTLGAMRAAMRLAIADPVRDELVAVLEEIYAWTDNKHTPWAIRAAAALAKAKGEETSLDYVK